MKKIVVSKEEYDGIANKASASKYFLENDRFKFILDYLGNATADIEQKIISNQILEVHEEHTITDKIKRLFITPKQGQVDELRGVYKWIKKFLADLEYYSQLKKEMDDEVAKGKVVLQ